MGDNTDGGPVFGPDLPIAPNARSRAADTDGVASSNRPQANTEVAASIDPDTCRICRGEGTREEALFYPCKCSGSIKYVHQDCLMEWLSHSQKKHCELCKTPFRFTKLYAADMPTTLPMHIFISHLAKYLVRNLLVWLRIALVASVWLGWLPYLMRSVWSFLFWISDEGLVGGGPLFPGQNETIFNGTNIGALPVPGSTICPSSPLFAATTTVATIGGVIDQISPASVPQLVKNLYSMNLTFALGDPLASTIIRFLFGSAALTEKLPAFNGSAQPAVDKAESLPAGHPSWLSEVDFLRNLTRHPAINRTVIATLEGQIITILVIVCFILIILVRDYVVQQQPEINMRAAFAAAIPPPPPPQEPEQRVDIEEHEVLPIPQELGHTEQGGEGRLEDGAGELASLTSDEEDEHPRLGASHGGVRLRVPYGDALNDSEDERGRHSGPSPGSSSHTPPPGAVHYNASSFRPDSTSDAMLNHPDTPNSDRGSSSDSDGTAVHDYLRLFRQAGGDHERILDLAREQGLEDKLDYWIKLTKTMRDRNRPPGYIDVGAASPSMSTTMDTPSSLQTPTEENPSQSTAPSDTSGLTWSRDRQGDGSEGAPDKGKQKAVDSEENDLLLPGVPMRPRANTDGPKANDTPNPLANNNWSFSDLPPSPYATTTDSTSAPREDALPESPSRFIPTYPEIGPPSSPSSTIAEIGSDGERGAPLLPASEVLNGPPETGLRRDATQPDTPGFDFNAPLPPSGGRDDRQQPPGLVNQLADFMWRDVERIDPAELVVPDGDDDFIEEENIPFGDVDVGPRGEQPAEAAERDREVVEAAVAAGLDPDAIEDAEDFEGIMELLGMRGPIAGLFQNAIFCAFLVSVTILAGIFLPYNIGRVTVWATANPTRPARIVFSLARFVQDVAIIVLGALSTAVSYLVYMVLDMAGDKKALRIANSALAGSLRMSSNAVTRIVDGFMADLPILTTGEVRNFSAISHEALLTMKGHIAASFSAVGRFFDFVFASDYSSKGAGAMSLATNTTLAVWDGLKGMPARLAHPESWVINLNLPEPSGTVDLSLAYWNGMDRFWAILSGYLALSLAAGLYLRRGTPFSSSQTGQEWEASVIDGLNQASGVMKVILIIGIEMLAFPLYCGMLLDIALLPLFEDTTVKSRLLFTLNYPLTSIFVHWFVGTGYMFHFALFVSMCRKIMRKGVLYFIRDPDDPEFHPVRDVLERNVATQLRKILFSAFVYGALVVVCLGGVVWGLYYSLSGVLPIHYSSNEPVLEFPIDLLFYNFLMPMAVKFFKPSDGLHAMYTWWFRKCARGLRLTWFLFGEREVDEEGVLALKPDSRHRELSWWRRLFLELDDEGRIVPKTWQDTFEGGEALPLSTAAIPSEKMAEMDTVKANLVSTGELVPNGRFVRAPASDQVKIPKGRRVFLEVTEGDARKDGNPDKPETDLYSTDQYEFVYVPPWLRFRIFLFIMFIWIFAAVTGVGITIAPLVFGRFVFKMLIPDHIRTNDIYAFSIGIYILGSAMYAVLHARTMYGRAKSWTSATINSASNREAARRVSNVIMRAMNLIYAYFFLLVVFPILVTSLMELYILIPLNTYMYSGALLVQSQAPPAGGSTVQSVVEISPRHTVRVIQSWTIGVLYLKLGARAINSWYRDTRLSAAVRAVLRRGWLEPDISILTRAFVVPGLTLWALAVAIPLLAMRMLVATYGIPVHAILVATGVQSSALAAAEANIRDNPALADAALVIAYRLSFPAAAGSIAAMASLWSVVGVFRGWKVRIRDEAYLIGERLHNFGVTNGPAGAKGAWRAGGSRM